MHIGLSRGKIGVAIVGSALVACAFGGVATAQPLPLPIDPSAIVESIVEPATPALYNAAQDNLVKGNYEVGLASLDALALASPSDANVAALQVFYRNSAEDAAGTDAALDRLGELDPELRETVERALDVIVSSAEEDVDYAPVLDGPRTAIVVLGFGLDGDGSMQDELVNRLGVAASAAQASSDSPIVVTGGNPQNGTAEADAMRRWLVDKGIAAERIHVENKANSTVQNAVLSMPILESIGVDNVVIATSANHIRRSISNFALAGADVIGAAADPANVPEVPALGPGSRLGLTVDATKVIGIPRTY